jgi:hypothetical protein
MAELNLRERQAFALERIAAAVEFIAGMLVEQWGLPSELTDTPSEPSKADEPSKPGEPIPMMTDTGIEIPPGTGGPGEPPID